MINRDEKIGNEIIKPKDQLIQELYQDNVSLHKELSKQARVIEEAEKYQNERDKILADNEELHNTVKHLEKEYKKVYHYFKYISIDERIERYLPSLYNYSPRLYRKYAKMMYVPLELINE